MRPRPCLISLRHLVEEHLAPFDPFYFLYRQFVAFFIDLVLILLFQAELNNNKLIKSKFIIAYIN